MDGMDVSSAGADFSPGWGSYGGPDHQAVRAAWDGAVAEANQASPASMQVPGPGASWGGLGSPPSHVQGNLPGSSGLSYDLDREAGTLNFRGSDGQIAASLALKGDAVVTPDGHQIGTLRSDGGFSLDQGYAADLARCHAASEPQMTPMPPQMSPAMPDERTQTDTAGRAISPRASMPPPGDCTTGQWRQLQDDVNASCKVPRSCDSSMSQPELLASLQQNMQCATARDRINSQCFAGGDYGHRLASLSAWEAAARCTGLLH